MKGLLSIVNNNFVTSFLSLLSSFFDMIITFLKEKKKQKNQKKNIYITS